MKRIEIATLMARDLKLAIYDEPEAGIDLWSFTMLVDTFRSMVRQRGGCDPHLPPGAHHAAGGPHRRAGGGPHPGDWAPGTRYCPTCWANLTTTAVSVGRAGESHEKHRPEPAGSSRTCTASLPAPLTCVATARGCSASSPRRSISAQNRQARHRYRHQAGGQGRNGPYPGDPHRDRHQRLGVQRFLGRRGRGRADRRGLWHP